MAETSNQKLDDTLRDADMCVKLVACGDVGSAVKASVLISRAKEMAFAQRVEIERLRAENRSLRQQAGEVAVLLLQNDHDEVMEWARGVKITFPDGVPALDGVQDGAPYLESSELKTGESP